VRKPFFKFRFIVNIFFMN